jgi:hypothetical protein
MMFVIAALAGTLTLMAVAVIARLRDPRAVAPSGQSLSDMLGTGRGRPNWRVLLIALAVIVAWLLITILLAHLFAPHGVSPSAPTPDQSAPPSAHGNAPPPKQQPQNDTGDMVGILLASSVPMFLIVLAAAVINTRTSAANRGKRSSRATRQWNVSSRMFPVLRPRSLTPRPRCWPAPSTTMRCTPTTLSSW